MSLKCDDCGRFMSTSGASWADRYTFYPPGLDFVWYRCFRCTNKLGQVQTNARPQDGDLSPYQGLCAPVEVNITSEPLENQTRMT